MLLRHVVCKIVADDILMLTDVTLQQARFPGVTQRIVNGSLLPHRKRARRAVPRRQQEAGESLQQICNNQ